MNDIMKTNAIEQALMNGNLAGLTQSQRLEYYAKLCESLKLNPLTKPFEYIEMNKKLVLYATKACSEQLRSNRKVSLEIVNTKREDDVYIVTAKAKLPDGREDSSTGVVPIGNLRGDALANAIMKAETKAKRRVTLSICGLGMPDESEIDTIPGAKKVNPDDAPSTSQPSILSLPTTEPEYRIPFGKWKGLTLKEIDPVQLSGYVKFLTDKAAQDSKEIKGDLKIFISNAVNLLGDSILVESDEQPPVREEPPMNPDFEHYMVK